MQIGGGAAGIGDLETDEVGERVAERRRVAHQPSDRTQRPERLPQSQLKCDVGSAGHRSSAFEEQIEEREADKEIGAQIRGCKPRACQDSGWIGTKLRNELGQCGKRANALLSGILGDGLHSDCRQKANTRTLVVVKSNLCVTREVSMSIRRLIVVMLVTASALVGTAKAQQVTGELGKPGATTTIDGAQLPAPDPAIRRRDQGRRASHPRPWWAPRIVPPKGAPNILLIMTDNSGYGVPSTFGGVIPTPALDRVAAGGHAIECRRRNDAAEGAGNAERSRRS